MQVVMSKCFLLNLEKNWQRFVLSFSRKRQNCLIDTPIRKNYVTQPKATPETSQDQLQQPFLSLMILFLNNSVCKWLLKLTFTDY